MKVATARKKEAGAAFICAAVIPSPPGVLRKLSLRASFSARGVSSFTRAEWPDQSGAGSSDSFSMDLVTHAWVFRHLELGVESNFVWISSTNSSVDTLFSFSGARWALNWLFTNFHSSFVSPEGSDFADKKGGRPLPAFTIFTGID